MNGGAKHPRHPRATASPLSREVLAARAASLEGSAPNDGACFHPSRRRASARLLRMTAELWARKRRRGLKRPRSKPGQKANGLLDLGFLELDVLARDRIVFLLDQLVGHGARVLLGDVIEARVRGGDELDLDGDRFGHGKPLMSGWNSVPDKLASIWAAT